MMDRPNFQIEITHKPILAEDYKTRGSEGAISTFSGIVREHESGEKIQGLEYEAYTSMAKKVMSNIITSLMEEYPILSALVVHRIGKIPVGECAIYVRVVAEHRKEAFAVVQRFMDRLKQDVPIWKVASY